MRTDPEKPPMSGPKGLFEAMAKELHVDLGRAAERENGEALARAQLRCSNCNAADECEGWLDASFGVPLPPTFCPNAPFFHLCIAAAHGDTD